MITAADTVIPVREAARRAGVSSRTLQRLWSVGEGPARIELSPRRVGVLESDLASWLASRRRGALARAA